MKYKYIYRPRYMPQDRRQSVYSQPDRQPGVKRAGYAFREPRSYGT